MAVIRVASTNDSPVGNLSLLGAVLGSMSRTKDGSSRETLCLTSDDSFSLAPNAIVHSLNSSNVIGTPLGQLASAAGLYGKNHLMPMTTSCLVKINRSKSAWT